MKKRLTTLSVLVPYKRAGNVITQQPVVFDVYECDGQFSIVPQLDGNELAVANLPTSLNFVMHNGKPVSLRGKKDGNFHVIADVAEQLKAQQLFE